MAVYKRKAIVVNTRLVPVKPGGSLGLRSDDDDDVAQLLLRVSVPVGLDHLLKGVPAVYDRLERAGLDELRDGAQVLLRRRRPS